MGWDRDIQFKVKMSNTSILSQRKSQISLFRIFNFSVLNSIFALVFEFWFLESSAFDSLLFGIIIFK